MAPHSLDTILRPPQWPAALSDFVTWCLMWDPRNRPTSTQALAHEYFKDALDPLVRPKSSSKLLGRKQSNLSSTDSYRDSEPLPSVPTKTSNWFRKSLVQRDVSAPAVPQHTTPQSPIPSSGHPPVLSKGTHVLKPQPNTNKRATWTNGLPSNAAPIPILPSIRPISPLSHAVTAQAHVRASDADGVSRKIGRQLSVNSNTNHYADIHRQEAERALNGRNGLASPTSGHRESFFSHLRKRARRFSGRYPAPISPNSDDVEANAGCAPWTNSNRQSMVIDSLPIANPVQSSDLSDLDKALQNVGASLENAQVAGGIDKNNRITTNSTLKRHHSIPRQEQQTEPMAAGMGHLPVAQRP